MKMLYSRCAGLDVHKKNVCACASVSARVNRRARRCEPSEPSPKIWSGLFSPDWLREHKVSHVAMESTGVFWIPVWNVLEQCETKCCADSDQPTTCCTPCPATRTGSKRRPAHR